MLFSLLSFEAEWGTPKRRGLVVCGKNTDLSVERPGCHSEQQPPLYFCDLKKIELPPSVS
jgi:hypothetical protein